MLIKSGATRQPASNSSTVAAPPPPPPPFPDMLVADNVMYIQAEAEAIN